MKLSILLGVLLMVASCTSGPTDEQKQRWAQLRAQLEAERVKNTEDIVDMFVSEVWNKPIGQIYQDKNCHNQGVNKFWCGHKQLSKPLRYTSHMNSEYKSCNSTDWARKKLTIAGGGNYDFSRKKYLLSAKLTYDFKHPRRVQGQETCREPSAIGDFPELTDSYSPNIKTPSLDVHAIRKRLVKKGVPLFYCYEWRFAIDYYEKRSSNTQRLKCAISADQAFGGPKGIIPTLDFYFEVKNGNLVKFEMNNLFFTPEETKESFAQVFKAKFEDPQYAEKVRNYVVEAKAYYQRRYAKQMAQYRAQEEFYRKQEEKREAEISKLRLNAISQSLQQTTDELIRSSEQQSSKVASPSLPSRGDEPPTSNAQTNTKGVRKCSLADRDCNPDPYIMCKHKEKSFSCHKLPIEYTNGMWRHKSPNSARACMNIFGNDKEAVWVGAFSRTHNFSSGRDFISPDPKKLCLERCMENAQKFKKACAGVK